MATITSVAVEEALQARASKQPSERTLRTRRLEEDAEQVSRAVADRGGAIINVGEEDGSIERYLSGLRSAVRRKGYEDLLLQKKRNQRQIIAWKAREEDQARMEARRRTGERLGQVAKERAGTGKRAARTTAR